MILDYQRYISKYDNISESGNIVELLSNTYSELLKKQSINFEKDYLLEDDSLISNYALVYHEVNDFPVLVHSESIISDFLSTIQICIVENGKLKLLKNHNLSDFLHHTKKQIKDRPSLFESSRLPDSIDKRLPDQLAGKQNFFGQINCGCGYRSDGMVCNDLECYSDYAWIEDGLCCIYFGRSASGLSFVNLFPFRIDKEMKN